MNHFRKILTGAIIAFFVAAIVTFAVYRNIQKSKSDAVRTAHVWNYVAANQAIAAGVKIDDSMLTTVTWSSTLPVVGGVQNESEVVGRFLSVPLRRGMVLTSDMIAPPNASMGLPEKIPVGMRGIAIKTDEVGDFGGFLFPGAHVDVLLTIGSAEGAEGTARVAASAAPRTYLLLGDVVVLTTGQQMVPDETGKPTAQTVVTILVSPDNASRLALGQSLGKLHIVLRNGADEAAGSNKPVTIAELLGGTLTAHAAKSKSEKSGEEMQIVLGTQSTIQRFHNNLLVSDTHSQGPSGGQN